MSMPSASRTLIAVSCAGLAALAAAGLLALRPGPAEAQGYLSAPACQCSSTTTITALNASLVHCVCGGMSCVISQHTRAGSSSEHLQCVR